MGVKSLAEWFWTEILKKGDAYIRGENGKWKLAKGFHIALRHSKILLNGGYEEGAIKRTILAMVEMGHTVTVLTQARWEMSKGRTFYSIVVGEGPVPCYDKFGMIDHANDPH